MPRRDLVTRPLNDVSRKVSAGLVIGTPLAVLAAWGCGLAGVDMPAEVAVALGSVFNGLIAYFVRERAS